MNISRKQIKYLDFLTARKQPIQLSLVVIQIQLYTEHGVKFMMIIYHIAWTLLLHNARFQKSFFSYVIGWPNNRLIIVQAAMIKRKRMSQNHSYSPLCIVHSLYEYYWKSKKKPWPLFDARGLILMNVIKESVIWRIMYATIYAIMAFLWNS